MSDLIIIGYPDETTAQRVWDELVRLQHDYLVDLEDAATIRRDRKGKLHLTTPAHHAVAWGDAQRAVLGAPDRLVVPVPARPAGRRGRGHHGGSAGRGRRSRDLRRLQEARAGPGAARNVSYPGHRPQGNSGQVPGGAAALRRGRAAGPPFPPCPAAAFGGPARGPPDRPDPGAARARAERPHPNLPAFRGRGWPPLPPRP